jgi:hypothetical protein
VLERCELRSAGGPPETTRRRGITFSPSRGSRVILAARGSESQPPAPATEHDVAALA